MNASSQKTLRVLIVDDNAASAQTVGWMVELLGFEAKTATSGRSALDIALPYRPHVVLLDIGIPDINGFEICRALRKIPELCDTLFIAQTGWSQDEHRRLSREAGFHHHLVKPIDIKVLEDLLRKH